MWEAARLLGVPDDRPAFPASRLVSFGDDSEDPQDQDASIAAKMQAEREAAAREGRPPRWEA